MRDQVFISYNHKDISFLNALLTHLKPLERAGNVTVWSDTQIIPGSKWLDEIETAISRASVAVMMVSPAFLASDFIHEHELNPLLKEAENDGVRILWVPVRASSFHETPIIRYKAVIPPNKPLAEMKAERDKAFVNICTEIKKATASNNSIKKDRKDDLIHERIMHEEHTARIDGYPELHKYYPMKAVELLRSPGGVCAPLIPISFFANKKISFSFVLDDISYPLEDNVKRLGNITLEKVRGKSGFTNEWKIRLCQVLSSGESSITFSVYPVQYHYYLATNLAIAKGDTDPASHNVSIRELLIPSEKDMMITPKNLCSNHIGISALLITSDLHILLPYSSNKIFSSPEDLIPSISFSMDWPLQSDGRPDLSPEALAQLTIENEILREYLEEVEIQRLEYDLNIGNEIKITKINIQNYLQKEGCPFQDIVPLGLCQNLERGGKPELFFAVFSKYNSDHYAETPTNQYEHATKIKETLPSPLSRANQLRSEDLRKIAIEKTIELADRKDMNSILRSALILFLHYVDNLGEEKLVHWKKQRQSLRTSLG